MQIKSSEKIDLGLRVWQFITASSMFAVSIYLCLHYFEAHFPSSYTSGALCDFSSIWSCDVAVFSPLAAIGGIPISALGGTFSLVLLMTSFSKIINIYRMNFLLLIINLLGCLGLFCYSLIVLRSLCPGCTLYYLLSALLVGVYCYYQKTKPRWDWRLAAVHVLAGVIVAGEWSMSMLYLYAKRGSLICSHMML